MRDLIIATIERNFVERGLHDISRGITATVRYWHSTFATMEEINNGKPELLVPWLKSLTDEQLLGVLESQHCQLYR